MVRNNKLLPDDKIAMLVAFLAVAESLSFNEAAKRMRITPSTISRRVKKLESELGVQLLRRTTRKVNLTEIGHRYYKDCMRIMQSLHDADNNARLENHSPSGQLIVAVPSTYARIKLSPLIPDFLSSYPDIRLELRSSDFFVNLLEDNIDVAIRIGELDDSSLIATKLGDNIRRLVASPSYLEKFGNPKTIECLRKHRCLQFTHLRKGNTWEFEKGNVKKLINILPYFSCDDASVLYDSALSGIGITLLADFITDQAILEKQLIQVLPDWRLPTTGIYALYPNTDSIPKKTRVFINHLKKYL